MEAEIKEEVVEEVVEDEVETEEEKPEVPEWLEEKDPDAENVPLPTYLKTKRKLKGVISERDAELERLKLEVENLKVNTQPQVNTLKRPKVSDFDTDEEFEVAMDTYDEQRDANLFDRATQTNTQNVQQENGQRKVKVDVDDHYVRVEDFITKNNVTPEVYKSADSKIREAVEAVRPKYGDEVTDLMISKLGPGSEKVFLYLGRSNERLAEFQTSLVADPTGLDTMKLLGKYEERVKLNKKRNSSAPAPSANVSGDVAPAGKSKASKKQYDAAMEKKDEQAAYNIRKQAKIAGTDTKEW